MEQATSLIFGPPQTKPSGPSRIIWSAAPVTSLQEEFASSAEKSNPLRTVIPFLNGWLQEVDPQHPLRIAMKQFTESALRTISLYGQAIDELKLFFEHDIEIIVGYTTHQGPPETAHHILRNSIFQQKSRNYLNLCIKRADEAVNVVRDQLLPSIDGLKPHLQPYVDTYVNAYRESRQGLLARIGIFEPSVKPLTIPDLPPINADDVALFPSKFASGTLFFPEFSAYLERFHVYVKRLQEVWETPGGFEAVGIRRDDDLKQLYAERLKCQIIARDMRRDITKASRPFARVPFQPPL